MNDAVARKLLPWPLVGVIIGAVVISGSLAVVFFGPAMARPAVFGVLVGLFGCLFGDRTHALAAAALALVATAASLLAPDWARFWLIIPAMAAALGWETARTGSKALVFGVMSWIALIGPASEGSFASVAIVFTLAMVCALVLAIVLGIEGRIPKQPTGRSYGVSLAVGLAIGLSFAVLIARQFGGAHADWIALMFVARALDPPDAHQRKALASGLATIGGAAAAGAALAAPLPAEVFKAAAAVLLVLGLRLLPARTPLAPALISAAVIMGVAPEDGAAEFRILASAIAAGLVVGLSTAIEFIRAAVAPEDAANSPGDNPPSQR